MREGKSVVDSLTPEQKARFSEFKEKWSRIGLSTAPADRLKAEKGISMIYETLGLNMFLSPMMDLHFASNKVSFPVKVQYLTTMESIR